MITEESKKELARSAVTWKLVVLGVFVILAVSMLVLS